MSRGSHVDSGGIAALFIRRPVLAFVLNLLIIIAGLAALMGVEIREMPDVDRPVISIRTTYEGATPETIDTKVTGIIESAVARVQGVTSISSSSNYGSSRVTVEFSSATDLNVAASDIRDAVAGVVRRLPTDIEAPTVVKADADASPIIRISVSAANMAIQDLSKLVEDRIVDRLAAVEGVADATADGLRAPIIRVSINPVALASRGLTNQDVVNALKAASLDTPSGTLRNATQSLLVRTEAPVRTAEDIGALYLNATTRIRDIAVVRATSKTPTSLTRTDGNVAVGIGIVRQAKSNTLAISAGVQAAVAELQRDMPEGVKITITSNDAVFIEAAIDEVVETLFIASGIVIAVIFLFLRSIGTTLIPAVTIPICVLGTIAGIWIAGFSINILTLLALVLATGLVVDDAIIVLENIQRRRSIGIGRRAAAMIGTREIFFAVISTTATLAAVFIPISFLPGTAGGMFAEFGFVLAFAVAVSSFVALSLCPVLASMLPDAKPAAPGHAARRRGGAVGRAWSAFGAASAAAYARSLDWCLRLRWLVVAASLAFAAFAGVLYASLPQELAPQEDRGVIFVTARAPQGVNLDYMAKQVALVEAAFGEFVRTGEVTAVQSFIGRGGTNQAFVIARLASWENRTRSQQQIQAALRRSFADIPGLRISSRSPNSLGIRGAGTGLNFAVVGGDYAKMAEAAEKLAAAMRGNPNYTDIQVVYDTTQPQLNVTIDREAAIRLGIPVESIATVVRTMVDEFKAAELFVADEIIEIMVTGGARPVNDPKDVENLFIKTKDGKFIPLSSVVKVAETAVAPSLGREAQRRAVPVRVSLAEGFAMSQAVADLRSTAATILPAGMNLSLLGEAAALTESSTGALLVFAFAVAIVFLVLSAQFESLISATIIMLTVPFGIAAALYAVFLTGGSINYYSQIGLVLLVGIMAKNGIMMVEFANQLRDQGMPVGQAIRDASRIRLRPVMMTMISSVLGGLPLLFAAGAGAESREALGWIVVGGLGFSTIFTLYLIPVLFTILAPFAKPRATEEKELAAELDRAGPLLHHDPESVEALKKKH